MQSSDAETALPNPMLMTEELSRALIANFPRGAAFVVDHDLRYLLAEGEALAIAGFKPEDFVGRTIFETLPPELAASYEPMYRQALAGELFEHEHAAHGHTYISRGTPLRGEDGEVYAVLVVSYDITDRKRIEDDRQQAEAALRESEAKYQSLFESIHDGFALLEVLYDADNRPVDCRFLEVSPSFEVHTTLLQAQGKTLRELIPSVEPDWFEHYHQALVTNAPVHFEQYQSHIKIWFEVDVLSYGNPQDRQVTIVFRNINDRKQAEANEIQLIRSQAAREQERQRAETLAELDRTKTDFFSNVTHEFRTPLTLSLAPLQDALSDHTHPLAPVTRERLELVHRNSLCLLKLVNTLLDFSRIEAGRRSALYEPTDLATYTAELSSVFRSAIEQAGLQLIVDCPPLPEPMYVDREMWEKIVLNLLSNAFKFTFEGEITVSLKTESRIERQASTPNIDNLTSDPQTPSSVLNISTAQRQMSSSELEISTSELDTSISKLDTSTSELEISTSELKTSSSELDTTPLEKQAPPSNLHVILEIRDAGAGIAPAHLPHLFERFYQVRGTQARTHEGAGIGLALVSELVRLHGGTIEVNSTLGEGTCFTVALPFGTDHLPSDRVSGRYPVRTLASTAMGATAYGSEAEQWLPAQTSEVFKTSEVSPLPIASAHVLVVDDNVDMREYLVRILNEHVQVEAVADGAMALAAVQAQVPDLILSDVMMPGLDGFELLQVVRADPRTREVPIILLSARAGENAIVEGLQAGADDYLVKPFSAQELISRVTAHLQTAQQRGAALQAARSTLRSRDEFISVVSHELNTPLVSILGWTRMLRSSPPTPVMLSKALDTIERNATLQGKLVQDILDLSRITVGKLRLNLQPIELKPVIETAIATVTQTATEKGIYLTWQETVTQPVVVMGDGDRLSQVFINLLTNAIKFTPESGSVTVTLSVMHHNGSTDASYAEIRVIDTGIGIAADFLPYVFERFHQAEGTHSVKGFGLGLAIAHHIIELHDGAIDAESAGEGQGATFTVRLLLLQSDASC